MTEVRIYTTRTCGYCMAALSLLRKKGVAFENVDVTGDSKTRAWLVEATGRTTVPQVFIGGKPYGGYTDLEALDREGLLDSILAGSAA